MLGKGKKLTAQGSSEAPAPAAVPAGGQASLSSDRTGVVMDRATTSSNATGRLEAASSDKKRSGGPTTLKGLLKPAKLVRYDSTSSIGSVGSGTSGFSALSLESREEVEEFREAFKQAQENNEDAKTLYAELKTELGKMMAACEKQPNISKVVKDGIKNINTLVDVYQKTIERCWSSNNECALTLTDYRDAHEARAIEKKRKIIKMKAALKTAVQKAAKRDRSPESSPEKNVSKRKKKRRKKKEEDANAPKKIPEIIIGDVHQKLHPTKKRAPKMLVKVAEGQTFASVLQKIKTDFKPEACNATVFGAVKTKKGDVLLKIKKDSDMQKMADQLGEIVTGIGMVAESKASRVTIEVRDLDAFTERDEVENAIEKALGRKREAILLRPNGRQQRTALVVVQEDEATKLEQMGHLRVGFISCRIRKRVNVKRCFRCLGFGHTAAGCKEEDRSKLCFRCGSCNHRKKDCNSERRCFLCKENNKHEAGSGACRVFRDALETAKKEAYSKKK